MDVGSKCNLDIRGHNLLIFISYLLIKLVTEQ
jgi:hypothetical protein